MSARPRDRRSATLAGLALLAACSGEAPSADLEPRYARARAAIERGDPAAAEAELAEVLAEAPGDAEVEFLLGLADYRRAFVSVGMSSVDETRMRAALEHFERAAERGERATYALHAGLAHEKMKEMDAACAWFERALERDPDDERALLRLGADRLLAGRLEAAADPLDRLLALDPNHADALHQRGLVHLELGEWESAEARLRAAVALRPLRAALHHDHAGALRRLGRDSEADRALAEFQRLAELQDEAQLVVLRGLDGPAAAALERGEAAFGRGDLGAARDAYEELRSLEPDCVQAWVGLGAVHLSSGDADAALRAYRGALERSPGEGRAHRGEGLVHARARRFPEALAAFERALAAGPVSADLLADAGAACLVLGRDEEAREHLTRALGLDPSHLRSLVNLALLLERRGEVGGAVELFRRALSVDPGNAAAREALERLGGGA